ncbi:MAG TPA: cytochrome c [Stellaceae bacterium]|nr:cytochrome c [Stellaceae bacterium]
MKNLAYKGILAAGVAVLLAAGTVGVDAQQGDKLASIKARQDFMKDQQHAVGAIQAFAKGTGNRQAAIDAANKLVEMSTEMSAKFDTLFPPGTSSTDFPGKTNAKPELWQHLDEVKAAPAKLHAAEVKLVEVVKTADAATVGQAMSATYRQSCNGLCHDSYRLPLKH